LSRTAVGAPLRVLEVEGRRAREAFIRLPWSIYAGDPAWVPPLLAERRWHLSPRRPYFAHARARFWLARRGEEPVGRISAQIDRLHLERHGDGTGFFGMLEARDDPEVFAALFQAAERWLAGEGLRRISGPFSLSINEECGLLVEGFDTPPAVMMGHARPYYATRLEALGYARVKDLLAFRLEHDFAMPAVTQALLRRARADIRIRPLRRSALPEELRLLREIFDDAWAENWGFIPFTAEEFAELGQTFRFLLPDEFVQIAEVDGVAAGMLVLLPDVNEAIRDLDGRLLPLGWLRLFWRLKVRFPRTGRVALMGVRRRYQRSPLGGALAVLLIDAVRTAGLARGVRRGELSWVLEDNAGMLGVLAALGAVQSKRYRVYARALGTA
jgi:hypothetical protein